MPAAKNIYCWRRQDRFQKDLELGSVRRLIGLNSKLLALQDFLPFAFHERFQHGITK